MTHTKLLRTDSEYARLHGAYVAAGNAADAASDGAIHAAHDIDTANRIDAAISRDYWRARRAFLAYQMQAMAVAR